LPWPLSLQDKGIYGSVFEEKEGEIGDF